MSSCSPFWRRLRSAAAAAVLMRGDLTPRARLLELFTALAQSPRPLRGDPFVNAAVEFPDPSSAAHRAAAQHRRRLQQRLTDLARAAGARDAEQVGRRLALLYDGAAIGASSRTIRLASATPTRSPPRSCVTRSTDRAVGRDPRRSVGEAAGERERGQVKLAGADADRLRHRLPDRRRMLEPVARTGGDDPDVRDGRGAGR